MSGRAVRRLDVRVLEGTFEAIERLAKEHGKRSAEIVDEAVAALLIRLHEGAYCKHLGCFAEPLGSIMKHGAYGMTVPDFVKPYCMAHAPRSEKASGA